MKTVMTPGYIEQAAKLGGPGLVALALLGRGAPTQAQPTWIIGTPEVKGAEPDDDGRTLKINSPFKFYAVRDDHEQGCDCGCGGQAIATLLLPEEY